MTDAEISRRLALAIGWATEEMRLTYEFGFQVAAKPLRSSFHSGPWWRCFDYRDPAVIWPIAERFNKFPYALRGKDGKLNGKWNAWANDGEDVQADTAAKAVALAVIKSKEQT